MTIETTSFIAATASKLLAENAAAGAALILVGELLDVGDARSTPGRSAAAMIEEAAGDGSCPTGASAKGVELIRRTARGSPAAGAAVAEVAHRSCAAYSWAGHGAAVLLASTGLPAWRRPGQSSPRCPGGARSC